MAVTRIKNNQITDSTITYVKLAPGTLVGSVFNANLTLNSNVTILGNLTVANSFAQLNSINTYINDPIVVFNNNYVGSPSYDIGMLVNRNLSSLAPYGSVNAAWVWKEADTAFEGLMTTETGTTAGAINNSGFANLKIGNITANTTSIVDTNASTSYTTGAFTVAGGVGIGGATYTNGVIVSGGNIVAASGTSSSSTTTGALVVNGGVGISGAVNVGSTIKSSGNLVAGSGTTSTSVTTGALVVVGGAGISGNLHAGDVNSLHHISGNLLIGQGSVVESADSLLTINATTDTPIAGNATIHVSGYNDRSTMVGLDSHGAATSIFLGRRAKGTIASPTAVTAGDILAAFQGKGYGSTGFTQSITQDTPGFVVQAAENFTDSAQGTELNLTVIPKGSVTATPAVVVYDTGNVRITSTTESTGTGDGALIVAGGVGIAKDVNIGGDITIAGNLSVNGTLTYINTTTEIVTGTEFVGGNLIANSGTSSSSTTTGALVVAGGAGVSGNLYVGGILNVAEATTIQSTLEVLQSARFDQTGTFNGNLVAAAPTENTGIGIGALVVSAGGASIAGNTYIGNNLYIGSGSYSWTGISTPTIVATDNGVNYAQIALKNSNSYGSADYAAYADIGNDQGGWIDMGIAGSGYNDGNYTITKPQDGSLLLKPTDNSYGGNLVIATSELGTHKDIILGVGSFHANAEVVRLHGNTSTSGTFIVKLPTANNNTANTGAFQVWGGTSISGNTYHGGATILNGSQTAGYDTIIRGKNDNTLFWARPSSTYDQVIIGNSASASTFVTGAKLQINTTDSILLPAGTSAQRPGSAGGTDTVGMFRYNTTLGAIEYYGGSTAQWNLVSSQFTIIAVDTFNGDGSTVAFTMAGVNTTAGVIVAINGVVQQPTVAYSVSGATLTFTEAPAVGDTIDVRRLTTTQTVTALASINGYMQLQVDNDGAYIYTGSSSTTATTKWDTTGAQVSLMPNVSVASANTVTALDSFSSDAYRTAKYIIQVKNDANYQSQEVLVVTDGTTATQVTYGVVQTSGNLGVVTASQSGSTTTLNFIATNATNTVRIKKDYIAI